jgi:hypothetical protein
MPQAHHGFFLKTSRGEMNFHRRLIIAVIAFVVCRTPSVAANSNVLFLVTNDDVNGANTATLYVGSAGPNLTQKQVIPTGGTGVGGGFYAAALVSMLRDQAETCAFVSDGGSNDVAGIVAKTLKVSGNFRGSSSDSGAIGIGLALNAKYLYPSFANSNTIATFSLLSGCKLEFTGDVSARGLNGGAVHGMALHGDMMVVAYGDGSIESFNIAGGTPISNGDAQLSTGFGQGNGSPAAVDISKDGHFAIFGDAGPTVDVEVSDISLGKLMTTVSYPTLFPGMDSSNIWLSPSGSLLYITVNFSGEGAAAFFDQQTGLLTTGCNSAQLNGYFTNWIVASGLTTASVTGTGEVLAVAEQGGFSSIGIVEVRSNGRTCSLTEAAQSPVADPQSGNLISISAYPPRPF